MSKSFGKSSKSDQGQSIIKIGLNRIGDRISRIVSFISKTQLRASLFIFFCMLIIISTVTINYNPSQSFSFVPNLGLYNLPDFWQNVIVESHGMLLDILVIGILLLWLDNISKQRQEIKRYQETIEDNRYWESEQAAFLIRANIKRLNALGIKKLNLHNCYLKGIKLKQIDLTESIMTGIDLGKADLKLAILRKVKLDGSYLSDAKFDSADFSGGTDMIGCRCSRTSFKAVNFDGIDLSKTVFDVANLDSSKMRNSNLNDVVFYKSNLRCADLRGSDLANVDFEGSILQSADLRGTKNLDITKLLESATLWKAKLDPHVTGEIEIKNPSLLKSTFHYKSRFKEYLKSYKEELKVKIKK